MFTNVVHVTYTTEGVRAATKWRKVNGVFQPACLPAQPAAHIHAKDIVFVLFSEEMGDDE